MKYFQYVPLLWLKSFPKLQEKYMTFKTSFIRSLKLLYNNFQQIQ